MCDSYIKHATVDIAPKMDVPNTSGRGMSKSIVSMNIPSVKTDLPAKFDHLMFSCLTTVHCNLYSVAEGKTFHSAAAEETGPCCRVIVRSAVWNAGVHKVVFECTLLCCSKL